jgi:hypothetical protein
MPIILVPWEAEIRNIMVRGQPRQIVCENQLKNNQSKMDWRCDSRGRVLALQAGNRGFQSLSYQKKKKKKKSGDRQASH